jgi:response regulator of citrate/malate metabolism
LLQRFRQSRHNLRKRQQLLQQELAQVFVIKQLTLQLVSRPNDLPMGIVLLSFQQHRQLSIGQCLQVLQQLKFWLLLVAVAVEVGTLVAVAPEVFCT